jgi:hypothetical protein
MRLPLTITTAALAIAFAAGPAQAGAAAAQTFTPPIGSDKGSVTAATPNAPSGIIAILIG